MINMKKSFGLFLVTCLLVGCGKSAPAGQSTTDNPPADGAAVIEQDGDVVEKPAPVDVDYGPYYAMIEKVETTQILGPDDTLEMDIYNPKDDDISLVFYQYGIEGNGYAMKDLDGDGVDELMFGAIEEEGNTIWNLYTIKDGQLKSLFCGWDRNKGILLKSGDFVVRGSSGAFEVQWTRYQIVDGELQFQEMISSSVANTDGMTFTHSTSENGDNAEEISMEDATAKMDPANQEDIEFTAFEAK